MRYLMRQKLFSFGGDFTIKDEDGRDVFFVDAKVFTLGDKMSFQDMHGGELAFIRQRLLAWGPTYEVHRGGQLAAIVKKKLFTLFRCRFSVDVPGPDDLEAQGDFLHHEYQFTRTTTGQPAASVSKKWFTLGDTYGVDVAQGEDDVLILAATVVVDACCHDGRRD